MSGGFALGPIGGSVTLREDLWLNLLVLESNVLVRTLGQDCQSLKDNILRGSHPHRHWFDLQVSLPGYHSRGGLINDRQKKMESSS